MDVRTSWLLLLAPITEQTGRAVPHYRIALPYRFSLVPSIILIQISVYSLGDATGKIFRLTTVQSRTPSFRS